MSGWSGVGGGPLSAWGTCIHPVRNQLDCGSCWAFAASEVLSDRFCIASNRSVDVVLSPQDLLSCEKLNLKCEVGSLPNWGWSYLESHGITSDTCTPYTSGDGHVPPCPKSCESGQGPFTRYKAQNTRHVQGEATIMSEIFTSGPVDVTFNVYSDFQPYCSEGESPCPVYEKKAGGWEGLHSVKMIGWGQLNGTAYWLVQNSWGTEWGESGDGPFCSHSLPAISRAFRINCPFEQIPFSSFCTSIALHNSPRFLPYPPGHQRVRHRVAHLCGRRCSVTIDISNSHLHGFYEFNSHFCTALFVAAPAPARRVPASAFRDQQLTTGAAARC